MTRRGRRPALRPLPAPARLLVLYHRMSMQDIADTYGVTRQAVHLKLQQAPKYQTITSERQNNVPGARKLLAEGLSIHQLAIKYGVSRQFIEQKIDKTSAAYRAVLLEIRKVNIRRNSDTVPQVPRRRAPKGRARETSYL